MRTWLLVGLSCSCLAGCSTKPAPETPQEPTQGPTGADDAMVVPPPAPAAAGWKAKIPSVSKLVYHFQDSSVPPKYHRSVTITVTLGQFDKVVDSYGDIISKQVSTLMPEDLRGLLAKMEGLGIDLADKSVDENGGCSGGTSDSLKLYADSHEIFSGSVSSCGGSKSGVLVGDVKELARLASGLLLPIDGAPTSE